MRNIVALVVVSFAVSGCVSVTTYKKDMAKINDSIQTQNANNEALVKAIQIDSKKINGLERDEYLVGSQLDDYHSRISKLEKFRLVHDKRWPWLVDKDHLPKKEKK